MFVSNIAPVDGVVIHLYVKDLLDITNVRINATVKCSKDQVVATCF